MGGAIGQVRFTPSYSQTVYMQRAHEHTRTGNRSESGLGAYNMHTITCTPSHAHHPVHTIPFTAHPLYSTCHRQHGRRNWSGAIHTIAFTLYHSHYNLHTIECTPPPPPPPPRSHHPIHSAYPSQHMLPTAQLARCHSQKQRNTALTLAHAQTILYK